MMKISIGADHGGVDLKDALKTSLAEMGHTVIDQGTQGHDSVDYPDFASLVAKDINDKTVELGILICTTGIGISISANKIPGIRAAVVHNEDAARFCRMHNDANVICLGSKYTTPYMATLLTKEFLETEFDGGERHARRVNKIAQLETTE